MEQGHGGLLALRVEYDLLLKIVQVDQSFRHFQEQQVVIGYFLMLQVYFVQYCYDFLFLRLL